MRMLLVDCESLPGQKRCSFPAAQRERSPAAAAVSFLVQRAQVLCCIWTQEDPTHRKHCVAHILTPSLSLVRFLPPGTIRLKILPKIETKGMTSDDVSTLSDKSFNLMRSAFLDISDSVAQSNGPTRH